MKPQQLPNIERAILSVKKELSIFGLEGVFSLSDIEAMLMQGYSSNEIVEKALLPYPVRLSP